MLQIGDRMKKESIKTHFRRYRIYSKRSTTINHAFASAVAPSDKYSAARIDEILCQLDCVREGKIICVYCGVREAQTWDHLYPLVKASRPTGHGHTYGNLVPSCKDCNSTKGNRDWSDANLVINAQNPDQAIRVHRLISLHLAAHKTSGNCLISQELMSVLEDMKAQIIQIMRNADELIDKHLA